MYFSDIYADRRVPDHLTRDPVLYGECLAGALYWNDFLNLARVTGFRDPRLVTTNSVAVTDAELLERVGELRFCSATFRLFRVDQAEPARENYGQQAVYRGSIPEHPEKFRLDSETEFKKGIVVEVCGNTFRMLQTSRFSPHFELIGDDNTHFGTFSSKIPEFPSAETPSDVQASGCC